MEVNSGWGNATIVIISNQNLDFLSTGFFGFFDENPSKMNCAVHNLQNDAAWKFIHSEILAMSIMAAFARARIYAPGAGELARQAAHDTIKTQLCDFGEQCKSTVEEGRHLENIQTLAAKVSQNHKDILAAGTFRIGPAQKALNLYLKYLWCLGRVPEPPHCPIDSVILACVPIADRVAWTQIATIEEYMRCITAVRRVTNGQSLAQWECVQWNQAQQGSPVDLVAS